MLTLEEMAAIDPLNEHDQRTAWCDLAGTGEQERLMAMIRTFGVADAVAIFGRSLAMTAPAFETPEAAAFATTHIAAFAYAVRLYNGSN